MENCQIDIHVNDDETEVSLIPCAGNEICNTTKLNLAETKSELDESLTDTVTANSDGSGSCASVQDASLFQVFRNLKQVQLKAMSESGPGVVICNQEGIEVVKCQIPRLEDRQPGQVYSVKDSSGKTVLVARRGLNESINITSGAGNFWLGRLRAPTFGRTFQFSSALGFSFDILCQDGDIFCCPCFLSRFSIVSHSDHELRLGTLEFNRAKGHCDLNLTAAENELNLTLNEKTIALICGVGIILFEWYFRQSELGQYGRRGSMCLLSYIGFMLLLVVTIGTVFIVSLHLF